MDETFLTPLISQLLQHNSYVKSTTEFKFVFHFMNVRSVSLMQLKQLHKCCNTNTIIVSTEAVNNHYESSPILETQRKYETKVMYQFQNYFDKSTCQKLEKKKENKTGSNPRKGSQKKLKFQEIIIKLNNLYNFPFHY